MPDRDRRVNPDVAASARRAAALYAHWSQEGTGRGEGEMAVFDEMKSGEDWVNLVCALLHLTDGLVKAARNGRESEYAAHVLRWAMLDEVRDA